MPVPADHTGLTEPSAASAAVGVPPFWRTYALTYAIGAVWLALEIVLLGTQGNLSFTGTYDTFLVLPPILTALCLLLADRYGTTRTLPLRVVVLALVASIASVLSTVVLTPVLVLMFRLGVGRSLSATGLVSAVSLVVVGTPLVIEIIASARSHRWLHTGVIAVGIAVVGVVLSMALAPTGALAAAMRLDQGEILMITSSWWLPVYALTAASARRIGMA